MMRQTVGKSIYILTHGKNPRGRGQWMFELLDSDRAVLETFCYNDVYSRAAYAAMNKGREIKATYVNVLP